MQKEVSKRKSKEKYAKEIVQRTEELVEERKKLLEEGNKQREQLLEKQSVENNNIDDYLKTARFFKEKLNDDFKQKLKEDAKIALEEKRK